jgi:hypothetical protein
MNPVIAFLLGGLGAFIATNLAYWWHRRRVERRRDSIDMRFPRCLVCGLRASVTSQGNPGFPDGPYCSLHSPAWREPHKDGTA